jgi:transglutaminase-like putative cysteine protease
MRTMSCMQRFKIQHQTHYAFSGMVQLKPHELRLRPLEGHQLRIESSKLDITPKATLRWQRDMEDNSVAIASFNTSTNQLLIKSEVIIQQYDETPLDFLVADYAINFPFEYLPEDKTVLLPYMILVHPEQSSLLSNLVARIYAPNEKIQSYSLLQRLTKYIKQGFNYQVREEPGVQTPQQTITLGSGSCRDFAFLFMEVARSIGFAARFVSGYLNTSLAANDSGATHAWAEVYLPGVGWKGFDPTYGDIVGVDHIAVSVARLPESVPPVAGAFIGPPGSTLRVSVVVTELP